MLDIFGSQIHNSDSSSKVEDFGALMDDLVVMGLSCLGYAHHSCGSSLLPKYST